MTEKTTTESPEVAGINRVRDAAKWLIGAYASIGAVLVAGLQLTKLGQIEDHTRLLVAVVAAFGGLVAVAVAIWKVANVLAPVTVKASDLAEGTEVDKMTVETPLLLQAQADSLVDLQQKYVNALHDYQDKREKAWDNTALQPEADVAKSRVDALGEPLGQLRHMALFVKVQAKFTEARKVLGLAGLGTAICVITFAWAANPSEKSKQSAMAGKHGPTIEQPSRVSVSVSRIRPSLAPLRRRLGKSCGLEEIQAVVVGGSASEPEVVTLPLNGCNVERFIAGDVIGITLPVAGKG
jgi:hypothetical protein